MHARSADFQRPTSTRGNGSVSTFEEPNWYRTRCYADPAFGLHSAVTCASLRCESKAAARATTDRAGIGPDDNGPTFRHWSCVLFSHALLEFSARSQKSTISNVAIGPSNRESRNHSNPLFFFPWARPALMSARVPHPTK